MTVQRRISWLAIATTVACLALFSARAEARIFMCVDGIKGDVLADEFRECIEVINAGEGIFRQISTAGGIRESTLVDFEDFRVAKLIDITSPLWRFKVALGEVIPVIDFFFTRKTEATDTQKFFLTSLEKVLVSSGLRGVDPVDATETLTLNFTNIVWTFFPTNSDGSSGTPIEFKFDLGITDKG